MPDAVWIAVAFSGAAAVLAAVAAFRPRVADPAFALLNDAVEDLRGDLERLRTALSDDLRRGRGQREETGVILREGLARLDEGSRALRDEVARRLSETHKAG